MPAIADILKRHFPQIDELYPTQRRAVERLCNNGSVLALLRTGGGKSLIYQVATLIRGGVCLAIFPLKALMDEQAERLRESGVRVLVFHSDVPAKQQYASYLEIANPSDQKVTIIACSPERLTTDGLLMQALWRRRADLSLLVIDEAHCVSQWGDDFRPLYKDVARVAADLKLWNPSMPILAMTATVNMEDRSQICEDFGIPPAGVIVDPMMLRDDIEVHLEQIVDQETRFARMHAILGEQVTEKTLVFLDDRNRVEALARDAVSRGQLAVAFHSKLPYSEKAQVREQFASGKAKVMFATCAFGMGMDIPDIRRVILLRPPPSIEALYQQIGRAGRDGLGATALIYWSPQEATEMRRFYIDEALPDSNCLREMYAVATGDSAGIRSFDVFRNIMGEDDSDQTRRLLAWHYLVRAGAVRIVARSLYQTDLLQPNGPHSDEIQGLLGASGQPLKVAHRLGIPVGDLLPRLYDWILSGELKPKNNATIKRNLIIETTSNVLDPTLVGQAMAECLSIRKSKEFALDAVHGLLASNPSPTEFHDRISEYLGFDATSEVAEEPSKLSRPTSIGPYPRERETSAGIFVQSKSEVIIANLLKQHRVPFAYEQPLGAEGKTYYPDFTLNLPTGDIFWEHLGMLDDQEYAAKWKVKQAWYTKHFPGRLIVTVDGNGLSVCAEQLAIAASQGAVPAAQRSLGWQMAHGLAHSSMREFIKLLADLRLPDPDDALRSMPYELVDAEGIVIGQAELAWSSSDVRVACIDAADLESTAAFRRTGWHVFAPQDITAATALLSRESGNR